MVGIARIQEKRIARKIAGVGPAQRAINILASIIVEVSKSNCVTFLNMPGPGGGCHILKELALSVAEHAVGDESPEVRVARAAIKIKPAIVVQITVVVAHRVADSI